MIILGIETTTALASVALWSEEGLMGETAFRGPRTMGQRLAPILEALLGTVDCSVQDIGAVAVSRGPGSFTSVRVGLATAKGLAQGLGCPLIGVPTLEVLVRPAAFHRGYLCSLIQAPKRNVYAAVFACQPPELTAVIPADLVSIQDLAAQLAGLSAPVVICGELDAEPRALLQEAGGPGLVWVPPSGALPRAAVVAELGWGRWQAGDVDNALTLTPLYLRPSEPEERFGQTLCQV